MSLVVGVICVQAAIFFVLLRNRLTFRPLAELGEPSVDLKSMKVSILIPARNEERVIDQVVTATMKQDWDDLEVVVLNDRSEDRTGAILDNLVSKYSGKLKVILGKDRPEGWLGKPWACQQLGEIATGDIFIFIDADTIPSQNLARSVVSEYQSNGPGLITVWPHQLLISTWEKVIVPLVYYTLLGFLVTEYTRRDPKWMPAPLRSIFRPLFAAACGQCLAMPAKLYRDIGGHSLVKSDVVEDVGIARKVRSLGLPVRMYHGVKAISCRMYTNHVEIFNGFRKNFLAGFGGNVVVFGISAVLHLALFVLPPIEFAVSLVNSMYDQALLWLIATLFPILQRVLLNRWMGWKAWTSITHVVGVIWFQYLGIVVLVDRLLGRKVTWKGRNVG